MAKSGTWVSGSLGGTSVEGCTRVQKVDISEPGDQFPRGMILREESETLVWSRGKGLEDFVRHGVLNRGLQKEKRGT